LVDRRHFPQNTENKRLDHVQDNQQNGTAGAISVTSKKSTNTMDFVE